MRQSGLVGSLFSQHKYPPAKLKAAALNAFKPHQGTLRMLSTS